MEVGLFLAKAWSLCFVIISLALLANKKTVKTMMSFASNDAFLLGTGFLSLLIGILHVLSYNVWEADWRGVVTFLGWAVLAKGVIRLANPGFSKRMLKKFGKGDGLRPWLFVSLVIGLYLGYVAWWA
ncbi:MAG: hypothetical protein CMI52_03020 [Parcubacteria group bacterium]|nr:hypothetical protein [Parcubacteria group bacterium]|tara:strand:+ start:408 stop:788 length:381 start_codon:yes stop_codon:yes gene_type:complete